MIRPLRVVAFFFLGFILNGQTPPSVPGADQTAVLQRAIDSLPADGTLDCENQVYAVTALQLKSGITLQNCNLQTLPGATDFAAPITIDGRQQAKSGITLRNIHITGNRHAQSNIGYAGEEDGARHCFRLLGNVANVVIENSSGNYCASDGLALVSYSESSSDDPSALPFQHIAIRNSDFSFNRRHGASADGVNDVAFENVTFSQNGTTVPGASEGDRCASSGGSCYGTGFWYEDYRPTVAGEGLNALAFIKCAFRGNYQRSMFFFDRGQPSAAGFRARSAIRILNSYLDSGAQPLPEDYAIQFQVDDSLVGQSAIFQDILIQNTFLAGSVGFRQVAGVLLDSSQIQTRADGLGYAAYSTGITFRDVQTFGKFLSAARTPDGGTSPSVDYVSTKNAQTYASAPPQSGSSAKGDIVWNTQANAAPMGWICTAGGNPCTQWQTF